MHIGKITPKPVQLEAKSRLHRTLAERDWGTALEDLTQAAMAELAGVSTHTFNTWKVEPGFVEWFVDRDTLTHKVRAGAELAVDRLIDIVTDPDMGPRGSVKAGEVIKAAELLAKLADLFPTKQTVVKWADRELGEADEATVDKQLAEMRQRLGDGSAKD